MGLGSAKVIFVEKDLFLYISQVVKGICCLQGIFELGSVNDPQMIISWPALQSNYGHH